MSHHRPDYPWVERHRERKVAGHAHANCSHAWAAKFIHRMTSQGSEPIDDRIGAVLGQSMELPADAQLGKFLHAIGFCCQNADYPKHVRHVNGEAPIGDLTRKTNYFCRNTRHFMHDDDRRALTLAIDDVLAAIMGKQKATKSASASASCASPVFLSCFITPGRGLMTGAKFQKRIDCGGIDHMGSHLPHMALQGIALGWRGKLEDWVDDFIQDDENCSAIQHPAPLPNHRQTLPQ